VLLGLAVWLITEANRNRRAAPVLEPDQPAS
jgi:hypothetical protein